MRRRATGAFSPTTKRSANGRLGGADGGAYIQCSLDKTQNVNHCTIWNDNTGDSQSADFRLLKEERAASESELVYEGGTLCDLGGQIWLKGDKILATLNDHH
jgi:hypothetical protein